MNEKIVGTKKLNICFFILKALISYQNGDDDKKIIDSIPLNHPSKRME